MRTGGVKRGIAAFAIVLVVVALAVAALPYVASTQIVRDRIAYELSIWSGYRVSLDANPALKVWPTVTATLTGVSLHDWMDRELPPVLEAETVEVDLSAWAALRGDIVFSAMRLTRPVLRLAQPGDLLDLPTSPGGGRMVHAIETTRTMIAANPAEPAIANLPSEPFGTIEFREGRINAVNGAGEESLVTSISGRIQWPALDRPASLNATAIWQGENVTIEAASPQPLVLIASGTAPLRTHLQSSLLNASFDGVANFSNNAFIEGDARFDSPSFRRLIEWSRADIPPGQTIGEVFLEARLSGNVERFKLENARLGIGANTGAGVLEAAFGGETPQISGTLDFTTLDIGSFLNAFTALDLTRNDMHQPVDMSFADRLNLDLRLSAASAAIGSVALSDVAATAQIRPGLAAFDISDARAFGGVLQTGLRIDGTETGRVMELRLMGDDIDLGQLTEKVGFVRLAPRARSDVSLILKGPGDSWEAMMNDAQGSISATVGPGVVTGFDLAAFKERWSQGEFFALADVAGADLAVQAIDFRASVTGGVARIDTATVTLENEVISLDGIIPYFNRALILSGVLGTKGAEGQIVPGETSFFIGGAWAAPYVSPNVVRWNEFD